MKDNFEKLPAALRKIILIRVTISEMCILTFLFLLCYSYRWELIVPSLGLACVLVLDTWQLFSRCTKEGYVTVRGVCTECKRTRFRGYIKSVTMSDGSGFIKVLGADSSVHDIQVGDRIVVYLFENTPVYDSDGGKTICRCMAVMREEG